MQQLLAPVASSSRCFGCCSVVVVGVVAAVAPLVFAPVRASSPFAARNSLFRLWSSNCGFFFYMAHVRSDEEGLSAWQLAARRGCQAGWPKRRSSKTKKFGSFCMYIDISVQAMTKMATEKSTEAPKEKLPYYRYPALSLCYLFFGTFPTVRRWICRMNTYIDTDKSFHPLLHHSGQ